MFRYIVAIQDTSDPNTFVLSLIDIMTIAQQITPIFYDELAQAYKHCYPGTRKSYINTIELQDINVKWVT